MTPIHLRAEYWGMDAPKDATNFGFQLDGKLVCKLPDQKAGTFHWFSDASDFMRSKGGSWEIVCLSKDVTEEVADDIVDQPTGFITEAYRDYEGRVDVYFDAMGSFHLLLRSKGLNEQNSLILKKV